MPFDYMTTEAFITANTNPNGIMIPDSYPWIAAMGFSTDEKCSGPWCSDEFKYYYICYDSRTTTSGWFVLPFDDFHSNDYDINLGKEPRYETMEEAFNEGKITFNY